MRHKYSYQSTMSARHTAQNRSEARWWRFHFTTVGRFEIWACKLKKHMLAKNLIFELNSHNCAKYWPRTKKALLIANTCREKSAVLFPLISTTRCISFETCGVVGLVLFRGSRDVIRNLCARAANCRRRAIKRRRPAVVPSGIGTAVGAFHGHCCWLPCAKRKNAVEIEKYPLVLG